MQKQFQAESQRLLDLMINSIYTHKEIFLREIISNASDAIDKLRYIALTEETDLDLNGFEIIITLDKEGRNLIVSDNGIGMNAEELEKNLGTIAFSGSGEFSKNLEKNPAADGADDTAEAVDIIGQFGVGFYSAFMVADKVTVVTKKYGEEKAYKWESEGASGFTIDETEKETVGTDIIMHIKEDGETEDEYSQYLREYPIYRLVKKYSDYIRFPIKMLMPHPELKEGSTEENPEFEEVFEYEVFNSMVPLWQRKKGEVSEEEYNEFYQQKYGDDIPPMSVITASVEGLVSYDAMLFIPKKIPNKYYSDDFEGGLQLYSSGVLIMESCRDLLPEYFNFVRGVVDSPDLSLNISREMLQHDRQLKLIAANLEKKIRAKLEDMLKNDREQYEEFFKGFGRQLKLCALDDYGAKKNELQDFFLFYSSTEKKFVTLEEYFGRMQESQEYIYYAAGDSIEAIDRMPQTEVLKEKNIEILYFTDSMDEFIADMFRNYKEKSFMSVIDGDFDLGGEKDERIEVIFEDTFKFIREALGEKVDVVKASTKLRTHPVCLSSGDGVTFEMEKYFNVVNPELGMKAKRVLELNVDHNAFLAIERDKNDNPERAKAMCEVLYNQALLIAGLPIENPSDYTDLLCTFF